MIDASSPSTGSNTSPQQGPSAAAEAYTSLQRPFTAEQCLFCNMHSDDFDLNLRHMQTAHGLFIPYRSRLVVDLETLVEYLHLVIFGYYECISCATERISPQAAQQHMMGKGHCRFDIANQDSEFADFYDFSEDEDEERSKTDGNKRTKANQNITERPVYADETSLRLPSGKIISKSSTTQQRPHRQIGRPESLENPTRLEDDEPTPAEISQAASSGSLVPSTGKGRFALSKGEKRESAFTTQLARLSTNDRTALMHLPASQQRSILATQQKQAEKAERAERRYQSRVEGLGNKALMKHFKPDVPGRSNG
ncbi:C2H2 type zinc-finger-domain-containing protein [Xylariales sp. AK1849]|nr:C2H2 type zinc-finger-domain-containing protein [Xylariales sp. AK1849]